MDIWIYGYRTRKMIFGLEMDIEFKMGYLDPRLFRTQAYRDPGPQTRDPGPGDPGTWARGPGPGPGPGPGDPDPGTRTRGPRPGDPDPGTRTRGPGGA